MNQQQTKTLDEIAISNDLDKASTSHNYTKLYSIYFDPIRNAKLKIFEIGIGRGGSLKMWKEFFPHAEITGMDIDDARHMAEDRINIYHGDQTDLNLLNKINEKHGPFDIIIDDGSHIDECTKISFEHLFPLLKQGGLYIIEDLHTCYWNKGKKENEVLFMDTLKKLLDDVNSSGKSGTGDVRKDGDDGLYNLKTRPEMTWWEKNVEFLHAYRSIVFIKKYPPAKEPKKSEQNPVYFTVNPIMPVVQLEWFVSKYKRNLRVKVKRVIIKLGLKKYLLNLD